MPSTRAASPPNNETRSDYDLATGFSAGVCKLFDQTTTYPDSSSVNHPTISRAIDRATEQVELSSDPDTTSAWADVLRGLEVVIEQDERLDKLEEQVGQLWSELDERISRVVGNGDILEARVKGLEEAVA